ncbi:hypothetical protein CGSSa00_13142 [Staphylococcus aureus subsp. aureus CGS00]|nr:hypothetical protein CGSSa00_13142 [Staphylococcus aureus subsp. aureus CGS00]
MNKVKGIQLVCAATAKEPLIAKAQGGEGIQLACLRTTA